MDPKGIFYNEEKRCADLKQIELKYISEDNAKRLMNFVNHYNHDIDAFAKTVAG